MAPYLRKRVWYQRYIGMDSMDETSYRVLFRKSSADSSRTPFASQQDRGCGGNRSGSKKNWKRPGRRCGSHDSESGSSILSDDEIQNREIKMEVDDTKEFSEKNIFLLPDSLAKCQGRMLMREWLEVNANGGCMSGLKWLDKDLGLVQIAWKHGSRAGWNRNDVEVFESWALHTGKFNPKKSDCKRWKANFRCALNSLPDVVEIKEKCNTRSRNPYKVYRLLPPHKVAKQSKLKKLKSSVRNVVPHLSTCSDKSDVLIKEEPVDQENFDLAQLEKCHQIETAISIPPGDISIEEIPVENGVNATTCRNRVYEHSSFHSPVNSIDALQTQEEAIARHQPLTTVNSIRHIDHSYANSLVDLNEEQMTNEEPDVADGQDLLSTINEELAKFCSSNFDVDLWNEETGLIAPKFILQDMIDSSDFDGIWL